MRKKLQTGRNNWEQHNKGRVRGREIVTEEEVAVKCGKEKERIKMGYEFVGTAEQIGKML